MNGGGCSPARAAVSAPVFYCGTNIFRTRRGSKRTCERSPRALWFRAFLVRAEQCPANISARQIAPKSSPRRAPFYGNNSAIPFKAPAGSLQRFLFPARRAPRYVRRRLGKKPSKSYFTLLYRRNSQTQTRKTESAATPLNSHYFPPPASSFKYQEIYGKLHSPPLQIRVLGKLSLCKSET